MASDAPVNLLIKQYQGETVPIVIGFVRDVTDVVFTLTHGAWATSTVTGAGSQVSIPISEARAAVSATDYSYRLVASEGTEGAEEIACYGIWRVIAV